MSDPNTMQGKWQISMDTPIGTQKFTWDLQAAGGAWQGTLSGPTGNARLENIQVNGVTIDCTSRVSTPMGMVDVAFTGAVAGDRITGTCRTMFGNMQFAGERMP